MTYNPKNENSRLEKMQRVPYDNEGFDLSFFLNYKFRDDVSPDKIIDKSQRFSISTKRQFQTFDQMRLSLESKSVTSKNASYLK